MAHQPTLQTLPLSAKPKPESSPSVGTVKPCLALVPVNIDFIPRGSRSGSWGGSVSLVLA